VDCAKLVDWGEDIGAQFREKPLIMSFQAGFFDVAEGMEKIQQYNSPILRLAEYIDFNFFRQESESYFQKNKDYRTPPKTPPTRPSEFF
jgi:hypothetical protein